MSIEQYSDTSSSSSSESSVASNASESVASNASESDVTVIFDINEETESVALNASESELSLISGLRLKLATNQPISSSKRKLLLDTKPWAVEFKHHNRFRTIEEEGEEIVVHWGPKNSYKYVLTIDDIINGKFR